MPTGVNRPFDKTRCTARPASSNTFLITERLQYKLTTAAEILEDCLSDGDWWDSLSEEAYEEMESQVLGYGAALAFGQTFATPSSHLIFDEREDEDAPLNLSDPLVVSERVGLKVLVHVAQEFDSDGWFDPRSQEGIGYGPDHNKLPSGGAADNDYSGFLRAALAPRSQWKLRYRKPSSSE